MTGETLRVRVALRTREAPDIDRFELVAEDGSELPPFSAGAHISVALPNELVRQYSLLNDTRETHRYVIAVLKSPSTRGGSGWMHESVQVGTALTIGRPGNHFPLEPNAQESLLLAGGIGVTPILCMARHLANAGSRFAMHYCSRSPERTAFFSEIRDCDFADRVRFHFDDGPAEQKLDLSDVLALPLPGKHLYVCGPTGFMDAVLTAARRSGWDETQLHREYFGTGPASATVDAEFEIELASSGRVVIVPKAKTVLEALSEAGVNIPASCEQGVCGTCLTPVLDGIPDHRDMFLSEQQKSLNNSFLPCCSRALSPRLLLDL